MCDLHVPEVRHKDGGHGLATVLVRLTHCRALLLVQGFSDVDEFVGTGKCFALAVCDVFLLRVLRLIQCNGINVSYMHVQKRGILVLRTIFNF